MSQLPEPYLLGTSDEETSRLAFQHQVWAESAVALWHRAGFGDGDALLDIGCGPGFATLDLARLVGPGGSVMAVDSSERFLAALKRQLAASEITTVMPQAADAETLDLPAAHFDGVFIRWLLCFLARPEAVIRQAAKALRPGGTLAIQDYFNYQAVQVRPHQPCIAKLFERYYQSGKDSGAGYDIGERLPRMLVDSGLDIVDLRPITFIARPGSQIWRWVNRFNASFLPLLVAKGQLEEAERQEIEAAWRLLENDPAAYFFAPPVMALVGRKPG